MLKWALLFAVLGVVMAALGFGGLGDSFVDIARVLFYVAIACFLFFLFLHLRGGRTGGGFSGPSDPH
ncbi:MAG: DUF1328 domain-containing protein [Sphingomonadaceae bacterium]|nr:DUF1328 domain-containing protein [Sphingomonadaceae bacterium]